MKVEARDDFGLQAVELHYSVNGGPEKSQSLLTARGAKTVAGSALLTLEDFHLVPGDIVSLYATAKDARATSQTDILFIQAKPFEYNYTQSQQESGNSPSGDPSEKIAEREKEIIAATWNQLRSAKEQPGTAADNAKYLADVQAKLRDQTRSLLDRMKSRDLGNGTAMQAFVQNMDEAVKQMEPAATNLRAQQFQPALSPEQKALQYLLRAEAISRDIKISMSRNGGGGQGGGATRDMENLSELELDVNKNQYESGRQSGEDDQQKKVDDAMQRLKELAKRQQQLAEQQRAKQSFQQRWEQEMLRREAEQLRRQMEQMAQSGQPQSSPSASSSSQSKSSPGKSSQGSQGSPSPQNQSEPDVAKGERNGNRQTLEQAIERLNQATREMSDSASSAGRQPDSSASQAGARRAAERLAEAGNMLSRMRRQQTGSAVDDLARQSGQLARREEEFSQKLREKFGGGAGAARSGQENQKLSEQLAGEKQRQREDLERLEHGMQQTARDMASTQPDAAAKMRDAISTLQQDEVQSRMKRGEQQIRQGLAPYAVMSEAMVVRSLHDVQDKLGEAQGLMDRSQKGGKGQQQALEQALEQAGKVRQSLEKLSTSSKGQRAGSQSEPGDASQPGSQSGSRQGSQSGSQQGSGGPGGGGGPAIDRSGQYSPNAPMRPMTQQEYDALGRQIAQLQQAARDNPEVARDVAGLARDFSAIDPRRLGDARLLEQLEAKILARTEEVEMLLRRKVDEQQGATVRSAAPAPVPSGYSDAVAEYYRRLSKSR